MMKVASRSIPRLSLVGLATALSLGLYSCAGGLGSGAAHSLTAGSGTSTAIHVQTGTKGVPVPSVDQLTEKAVQKVGSSVVEVRNIGVGLGSGVILTRTGYIVTNHHVVAGGHQYAVTLANGSTHRATLVGQDPVDDLAVIKISGNNFPAATFGDSSALKVGETVLAIGNPLGITRTVTEGIVSALNRTVQEGQNSPGSLARAIQTSAPINPGNSGGALVNLGGQVIGIPTLTAIDPEFNAPASGIGFAIPSGTVVNIAGQIMKHHKVVHSGRAALGIYGGTVDATTAAQYGLPVNHGVVIARFSSGSAAKKAGLQAGDIIIKVDNTTIPDEAKLISVLAQKSPGQKVSVTVVKENAARKTYTVTLGELNVNATG